MFRNNLIARKVNNKGQLAIFHQFKLLFHTEMFSIFILSRTMPQRVDYVVHW